VQNIIVIARSVLQCFARTLEYVQLVLYVFVGQARVSLFDLISEGNSSGFDSFYFLFHSDFGISGTYA